MAEKNEIVDGFDKELFLGVTEIINSTRNRVAVNLNRESTIMYWSIGTFVNTEIKAKNKLSYGSKILATLSQQLSWTHLKTIAYENDALKRKFYLEMAINQQWNTRTLAKQNQENEKV